MPDENLLRQIEAALPPLNPSSGNYLHAARTGNLLFLAGKGLEVAYGKVGSDVSKEDAYQQLRSLVERACDGNRIAQVYMAALFATCRQGLLPR
jgi:hypothetical protein